MELKFEEKNTQVSFSEGSNCTFMELKYWFD